MEAFGSMRRLWLRLKSLNDPDMNRSISSFK